MLVSWSSHNSTGILGYQVLYQRLGPPPAPPEDGSDLALPQREDTSRAVMTSQLGPGQRTHQLEGLTPDSEYRVCVLGLSDWLRAESRARMVNSDVTGGPAQRTDRKCEKVRTQAASARMASLANNFGLILGGSLGLGMVFILCVAVLCARVNKVRAPRAQSEAELPPPPGIVPLTESFPSYRHFARSSDDLFESRT